jgi:hypothetical protein
VNAVLRAKCATYPGLDGVMQGVSVTDVVCPGHCLADQGLSLMPFVFFFGSEISDKSHDTRQLVSNLLIIVCSCSLGLIDVCAILHAK